MYRNVYVFYFLLLTLAGLGGCSSGPSANESKKAATPLDKIQGKAEQVPSESTATDAALNAGGPSVYLVDGLRRYRLFFKTALPVEAGKEYVAEGGNLRVYDTTIDSLLLNTDFIPTGTIVITGKIIDVKAIDFF